MIICPYCGHESRTAGYARQHQQRLHPIGDPLLAELFTRKEEGNG